MSRVGGGFRWFARLRPLTGNIRTAVVRAAFAGTIAIPGLAESANGQIACRYEIAAEIAAPPGPWSPSPTVPLGISPNGQYVVGRYTYDLVAPDRGWIYFMPDGPFMSLPHPAGYWTSVARSVNDTGRVVGTITGPEGTRAFVFDIPTWQYVAMIPPDGPNGISELMDINASGVACGVRSLNTDTDKTAFIWHPAKGATNLGFLNGQSTAYTAISDSGIVAGYRGQNSGSATNLGLYGEPTSPLLLPPVLDGTTSSLTDINSFGVACGQGRVTVQGGGIRNRAFVWQEGQFTMLGTLPSLVQSFAHVISDSGVVGGHYRGPFGRNPDAYRAFLHSDGQMIDLNSIVLEYPAAWVGGVSGISDNGLLACWADVVDDIAIVLRPTGINQGDLNHDCLTNVTDLLLVISKWATPDPIADANNDGMVNVSDLLIVILNWGG